MIENFIFLLTTLTISCGNLDNIVHPACIPVLEQRDDWNRGDIDDFMGAYWNSEQLSFISGGTITKGWAPTLARYKARYQDDEAMGHLDFTDLQVHPLSSDAAYITGIWTLIRNEDQPTGRFTLILRETEDGWRIVHDHTSLAE